VHTNIRRYRVAPENLDEVIRRVDDIWLDRARKMPGFVSYQVTRTGDDELTSIAVFLERDQAERAAEASAEWVGAYLMDMTVDFLDMAHGPVVVRGGF
jgi:heme-degrading monooxygenase HmoA